MKRAEPEAEGRSGVPVGRPTGAGADGGASGEPARQPERQQRLWSPSAPSGCGSMEATILLSDPMVSGRQNPS